LIFTSLCPLVLCQTQIKVTDPNWYFTEYNWFVNDSIAQTVNPGAYFKVGFSGTSVILNVDETQSSAGSFMNLRYSIDDKNFVQVTVPSQRKAAVPLGQNLSTGNHNLLVVVYNSLQSEDRWVPRCQLTVTGLTLDSGARTIAPTLLPKRMLVYGDSITEGVQSNCVGGGDLGSNAATDTWAMSLASSFSAEVSIVAFGRLGYTIDGNGNVPPLFTPNNDAASSWNKINAQHPRTFKPVPDFIFNGHGANDGLNGRSDDAVTQSAIGWLKAQRQACPTSRIFLSVPFGRFKEQALSDTFKEYQAQNPDKLAYLVQLGVEGSQGLTSFNGGSLEACDGIHPRTVRNGQLGAMIAVNAARQII